MVSQKKTLSRTRPPLRKMPSVKKVLKFTDASHKRQQFFEQCKEFALQSHMKSKHCAVLEYNGKIIAFSANQYGADKTSFSVHAEQSVHKKFLKIQHKLKGRRKYNLWALRFSSADTEEAMNSKPCRNCTKFIKESMPYVSKVFYSWDEKYYCCEDPRDLKTTHISLGYQQHNRKNLTNMSHRNHKHRKSHKACC